MYDQKHIEGCKIIKAAGVTSEINIGDGGVNLDVPLPIEIVCDEDGTLYSPMDAPHNTYFPIGGDRFTDLLVRWLYGKGYSLEWGCPDGFSIYKYNRKLMDVIGTFTQALVQACVWVLKQEKR